MRDGLVAMIWLALTFALGTCLTATAGASASLPEARVQECVCHGMEREVTMPSGGRADCVGADTVTEIDRTSSWAEAIGQSLYYAEQTGKRARAVLFCDANPGMCLTHRLRFEGAVAYHDLPVDLIPMDGSDIAAACRVR